ncbi:hypothetical protein F5J12DRAFT_930082 [Pisolithus orientalis]|uniref:uncharacterized protein n=1 Tax=Pisolithus orientalis TaxID=936130 RepID=UPI00222468C6|nr:uncharacterized protein F5J12DRAFT_930082 [Pisolithus orientalis]KAI5988310.1 hypothetical protein F5J12DRAFT_930082 [Pisolithus orientalis]
MTTIMDICTRHSIAEESGGEEIFHSRKTPVGRSQAFLTFSRHSYPPPERARPAQRFAHLIIPFNRIHSTWRGANAHLGRRDAGRLVKHERRCPPSAVSTASAAVVRLEASQIASIGRVALMSAVGKSVARKLKGRIEKGPWQIWLTTSGDTHQALLGPDRTPEKSISAGISSMPKRGSASSTTYRHPHEFAAGSDILGVYSGGDGTVKDRTGFLASGAEALEEDCVRPVPPQSFHDVAFPLAAGDEGSIERIVSLENPPSSKSYDQDVELPAEPALHIKFQSAVAKGSRKTPDRKIGGGLISNTTAFNANVNASPSPVPSFRRNQSKRLTPSSIPFFRRSSPHIVQISMSNAAAVPASPDHTKHISGEDISSEFRGSSSKRSLHSEMSDTGTAKGTRESSGNHKTREGEKARVMQGLEDRSESRISVLMGRKKDKANALFRGPEEGSGCGFAPKQMSALPATTAQRVANLENNSVPTAASAITMTPPSSRIMSQTVSSMQKQSLRTTDQVPTIADLPPVDAVTDEFASWKTEMLKVATSCGSGWPASLQASICAPAPPLNESSHLPPSIVQRSPSSSRQSLSTPSPVPEAVEEEFLGDEEMKQYISRQQARHLCPYAREEMFHHSLVYFIGTGSQKKQADPDIYLVVRSDHLAYRYEVVDALGNGSFGFGRNHDFGQSTQIGPRGENHVVKMTEHFYFCSHLCIAMELLSINLIVRCGLKPELKPSFSKDVLLKHPPKSAIKVIDFGSTCFEHEKIYTHTQSQCYPSLEVILGINYHVAIDMWNPGCILAELYTGFPIFPGENEQEQLSCMMEVLGPPNQEVIDRNPPKRLLFDNSGAPRSVVNFKGQRRGPERRMKPQAALQYSVLKTGQRSKVTSPSPTTTTALLPSSSLSESRTSKVTETPEKSQISALSSQTVSMPPPSVQPLWVRYHSPTVPRDIHFAGH